MAEEYDFVIFGAGFGGSIASMVLRRLGFSVLLVEQGTHPRFAIGESSTPFSNLLLETISTEFNLPNLRPLCEWGSWQRRFPNLPCGLKRGFSFSHSLGALENEKRLLVAASPNEEVADTHWYRPAFDQHLVKEAIALGVIYRDRTEARVQDADSGRICLSDGNGAQEVRARMMIDASGRSGVLARDLSISEVSFDRFPSTAAIYAHFRCVAESPASEWLQEGEMAPYPPEQAAVHHVFDGGWIWVLRFNNGITSAGAALEDWKRADLNADPAIAWQELIGQLPLPRRLFAAAQPVTPIYDAAPLSFRRARAAGRNWALLPSAAGFVDPLLSTGFSLTLLGILRIADSVQKGRWQSEDYERQTFAELEGAALLVSALYAKLRSPAEFNRLTLLYFAALSFTETAWRLNKAELAPGFLLVNEPRFHHNLQTTCNAARQGRSISREAIERAIERFDVAGLCRWQRGNLFPVSTEELYASAHKLGATEAEIRAMLKRCGIASETSF